MGLDVGLYCSIQILPPEREAVLRACDGEDAVTDFLDREAMASWEAEQAVRRKFWSRLTGAGSNAAWLRRYRRNVEAGEIGDLGKAHDGVRRCLEAMAAGGADVSDALRMFSFGDDGTGTVLTEEPLRWIVSTQEVAAGAAACAAVDLGAFERAARNGALREAYAFMRDPPTDDDIRYLLNGWRSAARALGVAAGRKSSVLVSIA